MDSQRSHWKEVLRVLIGTTLRYWILFGLTVIPESSSFPPETRIRMPRTAGLIIAQPAATKLYSHHNIVLVGGGHSHVQVIKALHAKARGPNVKITLIDILQSTCYSGMVPGCITGSYSPEETLIDLKALSKWASIEFVHDAVIDVDFEEKYVYVSESKNPISFDVISLDIGSVSRDYVLIPGAQDYAIPTRPIHLLPSRLDQALQGYKDTRTQAKEPSSPRILVVGGGSAGIELAMSITSRWQQFFHQTTCAILDAGQELMPNESTYARSKLAEELSQRKIEVMHGAHVKAVTADHVLLENNEMIPYTLCVWATGAGANPLARHLGARRGLESTAESWFKVHPTLQSKNYPFVFCSGDCASIQGLDQGPPPKAGVYAVRAGPVLTSNLMSYVAGTSLTEYNPQDDFWKLLVCEKEYAIGFRFGIAIQGGWVWRLKNHIDRQFMDLFDVSDLPPPNEESWSTAQYDDADEVFSGFALNPLEDAELIGRSDNEVNYLKAWFILRTMANDDLYRASILQHVQSVQKI